MRILLVEDDALIALDLASLLEELGHEVCAEASDGDEAWSLAQAERPDLAMVDLRLGGATGGGALARRLFEELGVRSLFISGSITPAFRDEMAAIRPVGFLAKPIARRQLYDALREAGGG